MCKKKEQLWRVAPTANHLNCFTRCKLNSNMCRMKNFPLFFVGLAILSIFGIKISIVFLLIYLFFTKLILPTIQQQSRGKQINIEEIINKMFSSKSSVAEAKTVNKKTTSKPLSFNPFPMLNTKHIGLFFLGLILFLLIIDGFVMVPAGHVAVILDRGRGVLEESLPTGLHLKIPFWQKTTIMDTRLQTYTMSIAQGEGEIRGNDAIEALTKDGQKVNVDVTIQFYLPATKAATVYNTVGLDYVGKIVRPSARSVIRNVVTASNSKELFQIETREKSEAAMVTGMTEKLERKNLILDDVLLRNIKFSEIYLQSIEEKQVAEQKIQKARFEKEEAEILKDKKIIEAQAEAEAIRLKGESLKKNPAVIQFEMVQKLSPNIKWGVLPDSVLPMLNMEDFQK
jgi:prohibitin 2